jgi:hypothetical protein
MVDYYVSGSGFGAVLHQGGRLIAFFSRAISPHHAKLATYELELIGLLKAVHHWRSYLWMRPFVVCTDHYSLKYLLDQHLSMIPQHGWVSKLFGFQFMVEFKPGHLNAAVDALSRRDEEALAVSAISAPTFELFDQFSKEAITPPEIKAKREEIEADKQWSIVDDMVIHDGRGFMPAASTLWLTVLEEVHGVGHEGI